MQLAKLHGQISITGRGCFPRSYYVELISTHHPQVTVMRSEYARMFRTKQIWCASK
jgi:hypothetical protein